MAVGTVRSAGTYLIGNWAAAIITATNGFSFGCSCSADDSYFSAGCCYHSSCCACSRMPIAVIVIVAVRLVPRRS